MKKENPNGEEPISSKHQQKLENWQPTQEELQGIKDALKAVEEGPSYSEAAVKARYGK